MSPLDGTGEGSNHIVITIVALVIVGPTQCLMGTFQNFLAELLNPDMYYLG